MKGNRYATAFFMTRALLTTCGRNIFPAPNSSPTTFIPAISGPWMTSSGVGYFCRASSVSCVDVIDDPLDEGVRQPGFDGSLPPFLFGDGDLSLLLDRFGEIDEPLGRVGTAVEQHVFDMAEQLFVDLFVDGQLRGVDDPHVHAGLNRVIEKCRVHRLADGVVAAQRERHVADAPRDFHQGIALLDDPRGLEEVDGVGIVLFDAGRDGENVRVVNDVAWEESRLLR